MYDGGNRRFGLQRLARVCRSFRHTPPGGSTVRLVATAVCLAAVAASGCSSFSSALGVTPPQHKLLPEADHFRQTGPTPPPRELEKSLHGPWVVEPGDGLLVQPVDLDSPVRFAADQTVLPDGTIDLGQYGRPVVAGKTVPVIEAEVKELVNAKAKEATAVTVRLINRQSKVYYVLGEVNAPGAFPINGRETALDGIVAAGGLTRRANEHKILLSRPSPSTACREVFPVCYPQIVQLGDTTTNYQLQPGDRIYVPSKGVFDDLNGGSKQGCDPCGKPQVQCPPCAR
jgi:polysaccharide biosynthesis/export protein